VELIVTIVIPFLVAVVCAWIRFQPRFNLRPIPVAALMVLLTGSVLGHEFYHVSVGPIPVTLDRIMMGVMLIAFAWLFLIGKEDLRRLNRLDMAILALMAVISISTVTHNWRFLNNMPASRLLFFNLMPAVLYWVVRTSRLEVGDLKFISFVLGLFGLYLALTAIAEVREFSQVVFPGYIMNSEISEFLGRGRGPFLNPVSNGIFQTICFCSILMWWPRTNSTGKTAIILLAIVLAVGIYATLTRSVWLGLIAACGWFVWMPASRPAKGGMLVAATMLAFILLPVAKDKIFSFKRDKHVTQTEMEQSAQMRPMFATIAWNMFQDRPVAGVGFGQYAKAKYPYLQDPHSGQPLDMTRGLMQHNVFLAYLTETGLIGLSLLVLMLMQMSVISWDVWRNPSLDLWARQFGLLAIVVLTTHMLNGLFHDVSIIPIQHMLMFFLLGLVSNIYTNPEAFQVLEVEASVSTPLESSPLKVAA
jgi:O-antigen ligase